MQLPIRFFGLLALLMACAFARAAWAQDATQIDADACEAGEAGACLVQGEQLYVAGDVPGALALFGAACDLGEAAACLRLGGELEFPDFGAADSEGAQAAYAQACALGAAAGCDRAGIDAVPEAEEFAADGAEGPLPLEASADTAAGGETASSDEAIVVGLAAAPAEQNLTGFAREALPDLDFGIEITDAPPEGTEGEDMLFTTQAEEPAEPTEDELLAEERRGLGEACGRGEMEACEMFAAWLRDGTGGAEDRVRARRIFSVICTEGSVKGCYELGWMMYDAGMGSGNGLETNALESEALEISRARFLFIETCKAGIFEACLQGADMRRNGVGGRVDLEGAGRLYAVACEAGLEAGCLMAPAPVPEDAPVEEAPEDAGVAEDVAPEKAAPAE